MKYLILYDTRIANKNYKKGEIIEFDTQTDKLFIKRLLEIKAIKESQTKEPKEPKTKNDTK